MLTVTKEFWFCASHELPGHPTCGVNHGHNYKVEVTFQGVDVGEDMVIDFKKIKEVVKPIIDQLDHSFLNKQIIMPTAENTAKWLYYQIGHQAGSGEISEKLLEVAVWETPTSSARYRQDG